VPLSSTTGSCITQVVQSGVGLVPFQNPFGQIGTAPAFSPVFEYNLRARYDWTFNDYKSFVQFGANYVSEMYNQPATYTSGNLPSEAIPNTTLLRYEQPGYTTYDASCGVSKDKWMAQVYGSNLSNSDASVFTSSAQFIKSEVPLRPRVIGLTIGYKF
jgi:iron complex outermembrane receptor protein